MQLIDSIKFSQGKCSPPDIIAIKLTLGPIFGELGISCEKKNIFICVVVIIVFTGANPVLYRLHVCHYEIDQPSEYDRNIGIWNVFIFVINVAVAIIIIILPSFSTCDTDLM